MYEIFNSYEYYCQEKQILVEKDDSSSTIAQEGKGKLL